MLPAAHVEDTPDTPTIETLVDCQRRFPRDRTGWNAADTLKNVIVMIVHPDGRREPLAIGLPGDREVDEKRLEAQVEPPRRRPSPTRTSPQHPTLVKGYIGPAHLGEQKARRDPFPRRPAGGRRDPWVTGADEPGRHVLDLVAAATSSPTG